MCTFNPCKNGGSCYNDGNSYSCYCKQDYMGNMCEGMYNVSKGMCHRYVYILACVHVSIYCDED